jgi:hypothetical protein
LLKVTKGGTGVGTSTGTGNNVLSASPTLTGTVAAAAATLSGNLTLSGGTANGVAYLNGSKVVTSGSALTFDGTQMGVNIGPTSNVTLDIKQPTAGQDLIIGLSAGTGARAQLRSIAQADSTSSVLAFHTTVGSSTNEQMRLTSTGLGIGTSSPSQKLHVVAAGGYNATFSENSANKVRLQFYVDGNEAALVSGYDTTAKPMTFYTGGSLRATLDSSGNLGLGVTPSAWASGKAFEFGQTGNALWGFGTGDIKLTSNAYYNGAYRYGGSSVAAGMYNIQSGAHQWYNAPSGTAGNTITFTQAMTLDASGRLGIGITNPSSVLVLNTASGENTTTYALAGSAKAYVGVAAGSGQIIDQSAANDFCVRSGSNILFSAGGQSEKVRIDSSGNLLVGITSGSNRLVVSGTNTVATFTSSSTSTQIAIQAANSSGANSRIYMECPGVNAGGLGYIRSTSRLYAWSSTEDSGPYLVANGTSWTTNSDARLKTNVQNLGYGLTSVLALLPKEYEYKIDEGKKCFGFIAQDVVNVIPELVDVPEDSNEMMGIEYQAIIPVLVKAMQEQQAIIESLKARLDAANL